MTAVPPFHRLLTQVRGFTVTDSDPELTSLCVATETEELRKREEARRWEVMSQQSKGRVEWSGVESVFSCIIVCVCRCLTAAVFLPGIGCSDMHTEKHMRLLLSALESQPAASIIHNF